MKIGIIEYQVSNHYNAVISLAKIHLKKQDEVHVFVTNKVQSMISESLANDVTYHCREQSGSLSDFLTLPNKLQLDRIYFTSMYGDYKTLNKINYTPSIYLALHNISNNFEETIWTTLAKEKLFTKKDIIYNLRRGIADRVKFFLEKKKFIQTIKKTAKDKFLFYGENVTREALKILPKNKVVTVSFSIYEYEDQTPVLTQNSSTLKLVIPGFVDESRRSYIGLLTAIQEHINQNNFIKPAEIVLLGYYDFKNETLNTLIDNINTSNLIKIITYSDFVDEKEFTFQMKSADMIVGNMNMSSSKNYGKSGETGIVFNMIRYAKPALVSSDKYLFENLSSSALVYKNSNEFVKKLIQLQNQEEKLALLTSAARANSLNYTAEHYTTIL